MQRNSRAFGLVEVLVASIIIAIGLLGAAALQSKALNNMKNNSLYTVAGLLIDEMAQYIIANPYESAKGLSSMYNYASNTSLLTPLAKASCFTTTGCQSWEIAANDITTWQTRIDQNLSPSALGVICFDSANSNTTMSCDNKLFTTTLDQTTPPALYPSRINYTIKIQYQDVEGKTQIRTGQANVEFNPWRALKRVPSGVTIYPSSSYTSNCPWSRVIYDAMVGNAPRYPIASQTGCNAAELYNAGSQCNTNDVNCGLCQEAYDPGYLTKAERDALCYRPCVDNTNLVKTAGYCVCNKVNPTLSTALN